MEPADLIVLPRPKTDAVELDLGQIDAAIELVVRGVAARVRLVGLTDAAALAATALARAQTAGLDFTTDGLGTALTLTIGPRREDR